MLAIIPARGGSKRFPRKNMALLRGRPLVAYAIEAARASGVFGKIAVSSDAHDILEAARAIGADDCLARPADLAGDSAQVKDVCRDVLVSYAASGQHYAAFAVLLPTSPLRTAEDIRAAHAIFVADQPDCVMSLVACHHPPQRAVRIREGQVEPYFGVQYMKQTQRLEPLYRHDGAVILADNIRKAIQAKDAGRVMPYYIPRERSVDIDSPLDLAWAEFWLSARAAPEHWQEK